MPARSIIIAIISLMLALTIASWAIAEESVPAPTTPSTQGTETGSTAKTKTSKTSTATKAKSVTSGVTKASGTTTTKTKSTSVTKAAIKPKSPAVTRVMETQFSGYTSQDAESLFGRVALQETRKNQNWYVRGSLTKTTTKNRTSESGVLTSRLDSRLEKMLAPKTFSVWTGVLSKRDRNYSGKRKDQKSGYQFLSYGRGMMLGGNAKGDIGLGFLEVFDEPEGIRPTVMCSIRGRRPLTPTLALESDTLVLQPMDRIRDTKIDSEFGVSQSLTPGISLKLSWTLNNLIRSINTSREWDSGLRLSVSWRRTTAR